MSRIASARITPLPRSFADPMPQVFVTTDDGDEQLLFEYYPDEISFTPSDFVGLTLEEARQLKFKRDRDYLTRP